MDDITKRLRQTRAGMIGTDDERHYWDCHEAADEIERLRSQPCPYVVGRTTLHCSLTPFTLTAEEREAIRFAGVLYERGCRPADAATLRALLDRTQDGGKCQ